MSTVRDLTAKTGEEPITMLTAYDAPTATIVDEAGVDVILVGDSVANTSLGHETTLPVTVDDMARHVGAVSRATDDASSSLICRFSLSVSTRKTASRMPDECSKKRVLTRSNSRAAPTLSS